MENVPEWGEEFYRSKVGSMNFLRFSKLNPDSGNKTGGNFKLLLSMAFVVLVFVGIVAIAVFFIAVKGAERTLVPDVRDKELVQGLLELQVKELYPRIQLRYSQNSQDRGRILEQEPKPGTIVKAGRRVRLVVSQGVMLNRVENYIGRNIEEIRTEIQAFSTTSGSQLIKLKEPFMYDFSAEDPGTILRQKPEPGTDISGPVEMEFVVSRGQDNTMITVPVFIGHTFSSALEQVSKTGIAFEFSLREREGNERGGMVVEQTPAAGTNISSSVITYITVTVPTDLKDEEVFSLFTYTMPQNPFPLPVQLEALYSSGEKVKLFNVDFQGGKFTVPYRLPSETVLILSILNREFYRETVRETVFD